MNDCSEVFNKLLFRASPSLSSDCMGSLVWVSPLAQDDYREYRDQEFLERLGLGMHSGRLSVFWPDGGPCWDALAKVRTRSGRGAVLVEAKSHLGETPDPDICRAVSRSSLAKIDAGFSCARRFFRVPDDVPSWRNVNYQVCNQLAHLYFMNEELKVPTWLVWLFIVDDPDWSDCADRAIWRNYLREIYYEIGLPGDHPLKNRIITVCAPPKEKV